MRDALFSSADRIFAVPRRPAHFSPADLARAVKAVTACGLTVSRTEISPDGKIVLEHAAGLAPTASPFDEWKAKRDAHKA